MRPRTLEEFVGQAHVLGAGSALRALIEADELRSVILWGPAGTGKTSLAHIVARATRSHFEQLSATSAGVREGRAVLAAAPPPPPPPWWPARTAPPATPSTRWRPPPWWWRPGGSGGSPWPTSRTRC